MKNLYSDAKQYFLKQAFPLTFQSCRAETQLSVEAGGKGDLELQVKEGVRARSKFRFSFERQVQILVPHKPGKKKKVSR